MILVYNSQITCLVTLYPKLLKLYVSQAKNLGHIQNKCEHNLCLQLSDNTFVSHLKTARVSYFIPGPFEGSAPPAKPVYRTMLLVISRLTDVFCI
jgi:hypothetical protein